MAQKERKKKLVLNIIIISVIACTVSAALLTTVASTTLSSTYEKLVEETLTTASIQMADEIERMYEGEWKLDEDDVLWKGDTAFKGQFTGALKQRTGLDYAIFYDNIRAITTVNGSPVGRKNADTTAPDDIYNTVVKGGKTYYRPNYIVAGEQYSGVYAPVLADDGSIGGMTVAFRKTADINAAIRKNIMIMVALALVCIAAVVCLGVVLYRSSAQAMRSIVESIERLAGGDLGIKIDRSAVDREDELGEIADCIMRLDDELEEVIERTLKLADDVSKDGSTLSESSSSASMASSQVTDAMDEISKGAVSQAESVEGAATDTNDIGDAIEGIDERVAELSEYAATMRTNSDNAMKALELLMKHNAETMESMKVIEHQINATNEAVKNISSASNLITNISSQTNLLALNASIEAARAGEAGKGFAVVATEIGSLAEQSHEATIEINNIVNELISESEKSVKTVNEMSQIFEAQNQQLDSTSRDMHEMQSGVISVTSSADEISSRSNSLNEAKNNLVSIISDLSAISEENAASTQETNASMQELNATFEIISQSAGDLQGLAKKLHEEMSFFTLNKGGAEGK
ncbi:MAG: methyl-accepting chemotaxis protein [Lachnospiraceae bacterium]|nr:methyl-accepting chemotaxis protein [Lachnospiraceae bacterium]